MLATADFREKGFFLTTSASAVQCPSPCTEIALARSATQNLNILKRKPRTGFFEYPTATGPYPDQMGLIPLFLLFGSDARHGVSPVAFNRDAAPPLL
jgi:hypothetical protein